MIFGFIYQMTNIMNALPNERQLLLLSATIPKPVESLAPSILTVWKQFNMISYMFEYYYIFIDYLLIIYTFVDCCWECSTNCVMGSNKAQEGSIISYRFQSLQLHASRHCLRFLSSGGFLSLQWINYLYKFSLLMFVCLFVCL